MLPENVPPLQITAEEEGVLQALHYQPAKEIAQTLVRAAPEIYRKKGLDLRSLQNWYLMGDEALHSLYTKNVAPEDRQTALSELFKLQEILVRLLGIRGRQIELMHANEGSMQPHDRQPPHFHQYPNPVKET